METYKYGEAIKNLLVEGKSDEEILQIMLKNQIPKGNTEYVLEKLRKESYEQ